MSIIGTKQFFSLFELRRAASGAEKKHLTHTQHPPSPLDRAWEWLSRMRPALSRQARTSSLTTPATGCG